MQAAKFLDVLEQQGLVDHSVIAELRGQIAGASSPPPPEAVANLLVDNGYLDRAHADALLTHLRAAAPPQSATPPEEEIVSLDTADAPPPPPVDPLAAAPEAGGLDPLGEPAAPAPDAGGAGYDDLFDDSLGGSEAAAPAQAANPLRTKPIRANPWESNWLLLGGGALALIILIGLVLYFSLTSGTAADLFNQAKEEYEAGSYSQAMVTFEKFVKKYPQEEQVSEARVRIEMCRLRQAADGVRDKTNAFKIAKEVLPKIEQEDAFSVARPELASLLPDIADGFASQAAEAATAEQAQQYVSLADEALADLVNNPSYLPTTFRRQQEARVNSIVEVLERVRRDINRDKELKEAIAGIESASERGDTAEAYAAYDGILGKFPGLEADEGLREAVGGITDRLRAQVAVEDSPIAASTDDHRSPAEFRVVLASRTGQKALGVDNVIAYVLASGSVYALNAGSGDVLWSRQVGYETAARPQPISGEPGADALAADARRNELSRLAAASGDLVWRLPLQEAFHPPVVTSDGALITTKSGKVWRVDLQSGESARRAALPQEATSGAGYDDTSRRIYQAGDHTNLYVLDGETLQCQGVTYVGHKTGAIAVPPVMVQNHLLVFDNAGDDFSWIHVLRKSDGGLLQRAQNPIRLKGNVVTPPVVFSRGRVVVTTDRGGIRLLSVERSNQNEPVSTITESVAAAATRAASQATVDAGRLYVADRQLAMYEVQTARGQLSRQWIKNAGDAFLGPAQAFGNVIIYARRRTGVLGVTVTAIPAGGKVEDVLWEVNLGVPSGFVAVDTNQGNIVSISTGAELYELQRPQLEAGFAGQPAEQVHGAGASFDRTVDLGDGRRAFISSANGRKILVYDASKAVGRLRLVDLKIPADLADAAPIHFAGGLLAPLANGEIALLDPSAGEPLAHSFMPPQSAGSRIAWRRPAAIDETRFVIAGGSHLEIVAIREAPEKHLQSTQKVALEDPIASPLAVVGDTVYGVQQTGDGDVVAAFSLPDLKKGETWPLQGKLVWGPETVGDAVFLATDSEGLFCFEAGQKPRWTEPSAMPYGPLAGAPLPQGDDYILASRPGVVWRIEGGSGREVGEKIDVDQPLGAPPVLYETRLLLPASDGGLHVIRMLTGAE